MFFLLVCFSLIYIFILFLLTMYPLTLTFKQYFFLLISYFYQLLIVFNFLFLLSLLPLTLTLDWQLFFLLIFLLDFFFVSREKMTFVQNCHSRKLVTHAKLALGAKLALCNFVPSCNFDPFPFYVTSVTLAGVVFEQFVFF